jgi:predicted lipoprotein
VACLAAVTCTVVPLGDGPRRTQVRAITDDVIVPTLDEAAARIADLAAALDALAATPNEPALDAAQDAWRAARIPWKQSEAFAFGPAMDERLAASIDQASDPVRIDEELAGTAPLTPVYIASLGANKKGFHAIEHLIFRADGDDAAIVAAFASDPRRRDYATSLGVVIGDDSRRLADLWADGYVATLTLPGAANATFPTVKSVVDTLVNESVFLAEFVADNRIGKPLGNASGGTPQPELEESGPSDNSLADMAASLHGIRAVYRGSLSAPGGGIGALIAARSPALDREVEATLATALDAIAAVPRPFRVAIVSNRAEVEAAYAAVKELKIVLATEVVATLGATLKFNDNDGD